MQNAVATGGSDTRSMDLMIVLLPATVSGDRDLSWSHFICLFILGAALARPQSAMWFFVKMAPVVPPAPRAAGPRMAYQ